MTWLGDRLKPKMTGAPAGNDTAKTLFAALFPEMASATRTMHTAPAASGTGTAAGTPQGKPVIAGLKDQTLGSRAGTNLLTAPKPGHTGTSVMPAWLQNDMNGGSNAFSGSSDILSMLAQLIGINKPQAAPVDPNQSELYRQQAEQVALQNNSARQLRQGRIDMANLVNARNRFPSSNIGSLTYQMSPAYALDNQISALQNNGGYSTGWYGSMIPRTPWT